MKIKNITLKRKRKGITNYKKRKQLLMSGQCRAVIRKTNKHIITQAVTFNPKGDKVLTTITTKELEKLGWKANTKNTSAAYLIGLLFGKKLKEKGIKKTIPDVGMYTTVKGCKLFAVIKGIKDAGINIPISESVIPSEERIKGKHIEEWAEKANNQFQKTLQTAKKITEHFEKIKNKILLK